MIIEKNVIIPLDCAMSLALQVASEVYTSESRVTSMMDGVHGPNSYHPRGYAVDIGVRDNHGNWIARNLVEIFTDEIRRRLPDYYDVVLENDHIHIELDLRKYHVAYDAMVEERNARQSETT